MERSQAAARPEQPEQRPAESLFTGEHEPTRRWFDESDAGPSTMSGIDMPDRTLSSADDLENEDLEGGSA